MISENAIINDTIINAIVSVHKTGILTPTPNLVLVGANLRIAYGYAGQIYGSISIKRGQFELEEVTTPNGTFTKLRQYNHSGTNCSKQDYINALKCFDLASNQTYVSALIILTSESCRSSMVQNALNILLNGGPNFNSEVWAGLQLAFNNYGNVSKFIGLDIQAGSSPWYPLKAADYIKYFNSASYTGNKERDCLCIEKVKQYINFNQLLIN